MIFLAEKFSKCQKVVLINVLFFLITNSSSSELPISLIAGLEQGKDYEYDVPYYSETPLTDEEKNHMLKFVLQIGTNWDKIAKLMNDNRSPMHLKSIYNTQLKKRAKITLV